jgi:VanZ family protein
MDQLFAAVESVFGRKLLERFEVFWGIAWFAVVKSWHATEFAILTAALVLLLNSWRPSHKRRNALTAGIIAVIFAASDEFHQTFVPSREGTILDVLIDSLGVGAVTLFNWIKNRELAIDNSTPRTIG